MKHAVAIVGMACEYPGARSPEALWANVLARRQAFRRIPDERLNLDDYRADDHAAPDKTYVAHAAVIEGYRFDRVAFRISAEAYHAADLTHWLALDVAARALENAGYPAGEGLTRDAVGVLLGNSLTGEFSRAGLMRLRWPYVRRTLDVQLRQEGWDEARRAAFLQQLESRYKEPFPSVGPETLAGGLANTIAGRVCNYFDFKGGGYTLDGACASSLLAVAQACSALAAGDVDAALAGGVDLSLDPFELVGFAKTGALSPDEMRVFDRRANGFLPGEGCGMLMLRRLEDAEADGQRVYAVIRGWGLSSDGQGGITRPETDGQILAFERAYRRAGFGAETVGYFEAHGTGTPFGDRTELTTLRRARNGAAVPAALGFIKANIGHTKAAAGAAGMIKAAMALHRQIVPPSLAGDQPHELLADEESALYAPRRGRLWPDEQPLRAGVSAMGFGGINAHFVLENPAVERRSELSDAERRQMHSAQDAELFLLDAEDAGSLADQAAKYAVLAARLSFAELADFAADLVKRQGRGPFRAAIVADRPARLAERLGALSDALARGETDIFKPNAGLFCGRVERQPRIGLLFPGQAAPIYRDGGAWSRRFEWMAEPYDRLSRMEGKGEQASILLASGLAADLLARLGLKPELALGHSLGEIAALHWAGAFDAEQTLALAMAREAAMARDAEPGGMLVAAAAPETVAPLLDELSACISAYNGPKRTVISCAKHNLAPLEARLRERGVAVSPLSVPHGFHSDLMARAAAGFNAWLAGCEPAPLRRSVVSTVTGETLAADADLRDLLTRQFTAPVLFQNALSRADKDVDLWLEAGPGRMLTALAPGVATAPAISLDAGGESLRGLLNALGSAYAMGADLDAERLFEDRYLQPFDPERAWAFLVNPCERAPQSDAAVILEPVHADDPAPESPTAPVDPAADPLDAVRRLIAEKTELPMSEVRDDLRMLNDFHLNSIAVAALVVEAARRLDKPAPSSPMDYANATVAEIAEALISLDGQSARKPGESAFPDGVGPWVRRFEIEWRQSPRRQRRPQNRPVGEWRVLGPEHPFREALSAAAADKPGGGFLVVLPAELDQASRLAWLLRVACDFEIEGGQFAVVQETEGAASFARSLAQEHPKTDVCVVTAPFDMAEAAEWAMAECAAAEGFVEARFQPDGARQTPVIRAEQARRPATVAALGADDVLLVSGGGKGIVAECALAAARELGVKLILVGRSRPEEDDALRANLARFRRHGAAYCYVSADVCDREALIDAVAQAQAELGPATAILHGAGRNEPQLIAGLTPAACRATLAPKLEGLTNLLAAVTPERLKWLCCFGSIIARMGLAGEAHYGYANEQLALAAEEFGRECPGCRVTTLEWSVWSGVGMGARVAHIENLRRLGIMPISIEDGAAAFVAAAADPDLYGARIVAGRFGPPPTVALEATEPPFLRFLQQTRIHYPDVELVVEFELSLDDDPYLRDHVYDGAPLFPTVFGLEAMSQAAMALCGEAAPPRRVTRLALQRPIIVPETGKTRLRVAALKRADGAVDAVIRCQESEFQVDHIRARLSFDSLEETVARPAPAQAPPALAMDAQNELYGPLFFHDGRFRRITAFHRLGAFQCLAQITPTPASEPWYSRFLPQSLVLGDPGMRDALLHGIQACIPQASLLPLNVKEIRVYDTDDATPRFLEAKELGRVDDVFTYDLWAIDENGRVLERWREVQFKRVRDAAPRPDWPPALYGPYLERIVRERAQRAAPRFALEPGEVRDARGRQAYLRLEGASALHKREDGKPLANDGDVSFAHCGDLTLCAVGRDRLACDLERVEMRPAETWSGMLGARFALAELLVRERGESLDLAATRVWTALECLRKIGVSAGAALTLAASDGGRTWFVADDVEVVTAAMTAEDGAEPLVLAACYPPDAHADPAAFGVGALSDELPN